MHQGSTISVQRESESAVENVATTFAEKATTSPVMIAETPAGVDKITSATETIVGIEARAEDAIGHVVATGTSVAVIGEVQSAAVVAVKRKRRSHAVLNEDVPRNSSEIEKLHKKEKKHKRKR